MQKSEFVVGKLDLTSVVGLLRRIRWCFRGRLGRRIRGSLRGCVGGILYRRLSRRFRGRLSRRIRRLGEDDLLRKGGLRVRGGFRGGLRRGICGLLRRIRNRIRLRCFSDTAAQQKAQCQQHYDQLLNHWQPHKPRRSHRSRALPASGVPARHFPSLRQHRKLRCRSAFR